MKAYDELVHILQPVKDKLLQVIRYQDAFGGLKAVIVLEEEMPGHFDALQALRAYCKKQKLAYPLVVTRYFLESSCDSYPLELIDFGHSYENLYLTEDLLATLQYTRGDVRLQMERELKSKWLLTRMAILEQKPSPVLMAEVMHKSIAAIMPVLKGFHWLAQKPIPSDYQQLLMGCAAITGLDLDLLARCLAFKKIEAKLVWQYLKLLENLMLKLEIVAQ